MSFFCLCAAYAITGDDKEFRVDGYKVVELDPEIFSERKQGILPPERAMVASIGHRQFLASVPNIGDNVKSGSVVYEHFPNVDIFRCPLCGAGFARG